MNRRERIALGLMLLLFGVCGCAHAPPPVHDSAAFVRCARTCGDESGPVYPFVI